MSETAKHRDKVLPYCHGNGVDIGCGDDPIHPRAVSLDLPDHLFSHYRGGEKGKHIWQGHAQDLPFKDGVCDYVYASHILEDFLDWEPILTEWKRVLKPNGFLVILVPDKVRWNTAIQNGQPPNCAHKHESYEGELSTYCKDMNILKDELTEDYTILFVAQKI